VKASSWTGWSFEPLVRIVRRLRGALGFNSVVHSSREYSIS
jgi:hypothetical protein